MKIELKIGDCGPILCGNGEPIGCVQKMSLEWRGDDLTNGLLPYVNVSFIPEELVVDGRKIFDIKDRQFKPEEKSQNDQETTVR